MSATFPARQPVRTVVDKGLDILGAIIGWSLVIGALDLIVAAAIHFLHWLVA
jgi:hypothetical protein